MIGSIAYFPLQCALNSGPPMSAVLSALKSRGIDTVENSWDADAAVVWSVLWHGRMAENQTVYQHYRNHNKPVIVLDVGTLLRNQTWKLAVNNITADGYYGHRSNLDSDRPKKLGIELKTLVRSDPGVLITAQHRKSLAVSDLLSVEDWINAQINKIRQYTDRPITVRPHPRSTLKADTLLPGVTVESPRRVPNSYDSYDLEFRHHAVINYNSGPGIQAALAGVRPVVDRTSLAYPVAVKYSNIEQPYTVDRSQWLIEICHTEYTVEELASGSWLERIEPALT